ncbi:MAG: transporter substrate-binding domain-containing protein [Oscillospiraceae bacterium]|jgi:ABC-type amino acid transport substrate-binding protein|nr:transporter substrate-binding domain-containing protein [Oscillospiraceae bacterium]
MFSKTCGNRRHTYKTLVTIALALTLAVSFSSCSKTPPSTVNSNADVAGRVIGYVAGTVSAAFAGRYGTAREYQTAAAMSADLRLGAIDCAITDAESAAAIVSSSGGLRVLSEPLYALDLRVASQTEYPDLKLAIGGAITALRDAGTLAALHKHYFANGAAVSIPTPSGDGTLTLALPATPYPPYVSYEGGEPSGFAVDVARLICAKLGVALEIESFPDAKLLDTVRLGRESYFAMCWEFGAEEDASRAVYSVPYATLELFVVTRK